MNVTATTASPADATSTLFVALELSRSTWIVALHSPVADQDQPASRRRRRRRSLAGIDRATAEAIRGEVSSTGAGRVLL